MTRIKDYADTTVGFCDPVNGLVEIKGVHGNYGSVCLQVGQDFRIVNPDTRTETVIVRSSRDLLAVSAYKFGSASKQRRYCIGSVINHN